MGNVLDVFDEENEEINEESNVESHTWKNEWIDMPEFVQEAQKPYAMINIRFETKEALDEFASIIGQKLTNKTKSIWHPQLVRGINSGKRWVDES